MKEVGHTAECFHATPTFGGDSRIAEPAGRCVPLSGGNCRHSQCRLARSCRGGLLVEARPNQGILLLLDPVPDVSRCSATHEALLQMKVMTIGQEGKPD